MARGHAAQDPVERDVTVVRLLWQGVMLPKILLKEMSQWSGFYGKGHAAQDPVEGDVTVVRLLWQGVMLPKILLKEMSQWSGFYGKGSCCPRSC